MILLPRQMNIQCALLGMMGHQFAEIMQILFSHLNIHSVQNILGLGITNFSPNAIISLDKGYSAY